jgi:hypothetical protein
MLHHLSRISREKHFDTILTGEIHQIEITHIETKFWMEGELLNQELKFSVKGFLTLSSLK